MYYILTCTCKDIIHDNIQGFYSGPGTKLTSCERSIGPLHDPVTWYKITHAGKQVAQWDFLVNNALGTSPPGAAFVLEFPLCNLVTSMCDFIPCDRIMQTAYCLTGLTSVLQRFPMHQSMGVMGDYVTCSKVTSKPRLHDIFSDLRFPCDFFTWVFFSSWLLWELVHDKI